MKKSDLRQMIREEVQRELYAVLPTLIQEALSSVVKRVAKPAGRKTVKESASPSKPFDAAARSRLSELLGYGNLNKESFRTKKEDGAKPEPKIIAGVPVTGGLRAKEAAAGMTNLSNLSWDDPNGGGPSLLEGAMADAAPSGPELPNQVVAALGEHALKVFNAAKERGNWRPGKKKNG